MDIDQQRPVGVAGSKVLDPRSFAETLGIVTWLMTMSNDHREKKIAHVEQLILPALLLKQFKLIKRNNQPKAFLSWATLSEEAHQIFREAGTLTLQQWRSGKILTVVDCISPFAPREMVERAFFEDSNKRKL